MRSLKGSKFEIRRKPPVFHFLRLSWTLPSQGLRKRPQGSQHDLGMTVTSGNSLCAFLGRSPPRNVYTVLMISPRFSKPFFMKLSYTKWEMSGFVAMKTWPPGTRTHLSNEARRKEQSRSDFWSVSVRTVKRGSC